MRTAFFVFISLCISISSGTARAQAQSGGSWIGKPAPEFSSGEWINSEPVTLQSLRGKVVLVEFWTFGCYNCRNTIPYLNSWYESFPADRFCIVGVHSPEFEREKVTAEVRRKVRDLGIRYAVVTDNDFGTWRSYNQRYWPVMYLVDGEGIIRNVQIGEGGYDEMKNMIADLISKTAE